MFMINSNQEKQNIKAHKIIQVLQFYCSNKNGVMDRRGVHRGKCLLEDCDCSQYELPSDEQNHLCAYCGDPPAKHLIVQATIQDAEKPEAEISTNSPVSSSSKAYSNPWENKALGWIHAPARPSGIFYNALMPKFYKSFWPFYPCVSQFRKAFLAERHRQFETTRKLEDISKKYDYLISENPACAGRLLKKDYAPKSGDSTLINEIKCSISKLIDLLNIIGDNIKDHDNTLFLQGGRRMKSGKNCHHDFNNSVKLNIGNLESKFLDLQQRLVKCEETCEAVWKHKYKAKGISERKRKLNNALKVEKRRKLCMLRKVLQVHTSLGGQSEGNCYSPELGIPQITTLACPLDELPQKNICYLLQILLKEGCFRGEALEEVQSYLTSETDSDGYEDI